MASGRDFGKQERPKAALLAALLLLAGNGDLAGGAAEELTAGDFLDEVGVDMARLQQADAVFQPRPVGMDGGEFLLLHGEPRLNV